MTAPMVSDDMVHQAVRAYVQAGKRGCNDLAAAIRCAVEAAMAVATAPKAQPVVEHPDTPRLDWLLPNLHPATWGMEFPGGFEWNSEEEFKAKWRAAIDAELRADAVLPSMGGSSNG